MDHKLTIPNYKLTKTEEIEEWVKELNPEDLLKNRVLLVNEDGYSNQLVNKDIFAIEKEYRNILRIQIFKDKVYIDYDPKKELSKIVRVVIMGNEYYKAAKEIMNGIEFKDVKTFFAKYSRDEGYELKVYGINFILKDKSHNGSTYKFWIQNKSQNIKGQDKTEKLFQKSFDKINEQSVKRMIREA